MTVENFVPKTLPQRRSQLLEC